VVMPRDKEHAKDFVAYGTPTDGCPDPVLRTIDNLRAQVGHLMERVDELEGELAQAEKPQSGSKTNRIANSGGEA